MRFAGRMECAGPQVAFTTLQRSALGASYIPALAKFDEGSKVAARIQNRFNDGSLAREIMLMCTPFQPANAHARSRPSVFRPVTRNLPCCVDNQPGPGATS